MSKYDDIEQLLEKLAKENPEEMDKIDEIDDSVFDRIESRAIMQAEGKKKKAGNYFFLKAVAGLVVLFGVFSIALFMFDMPSTRATENPTTAPEETPLFEAHAINFPQHIPEGYDMEYVVPQTDKNGYQGYEIKYVGTDAESQYILIKVYGDLILYDLNVEREVSEYTLNDMPLMLTKIYSSPVVLYVYFIDGWGDIVQIVTTLDEETLMNVIKSMH